MDFRKTKSEGCNFSIMATVHCLVFLISPATLANINKPIKQSVAEFPVPFQKWVIDPERGETKTDLKRKWHRLSPHSPLPERSKSETELRILVYYKRLANI